MAIPGHAVWKLVFKNRIHYSNSHAGVLSCFYSWWLEDITFYFRTKQGWKLVLEYSPTDRCRCGRAYDYSFNGEDCRRLENKEIPLNSAKDVVEIMQLPQLCQICYYQQEYTAGRWCPRWVKEQLGIAT